MKKQSLTTKQMALIGVMTAVACILGPLSLPIPISPVPVSLGVLAVCLTAYVLGPKLGAFSVLLYLLTGLAGLPVFTGFTGGIGKLAGPTGGYLIGYVFMLLIAGWFIDHFDGKPVPSVIGMILGNSVLYLFGTAWLAHQASLTFTEALAAGVLPYIAVDLAKIAAAAAIGTQLRRAVKKIYSFA